MAGASIAHVGSSISVCLFGDLSSNQPRICDYDQALRIHYNTEKCDRTDVLNNTTDDMIAMRAGLIKLTWHPFGVLYSLINIDYVWRSTYRATIKCAPAIHIFDRMCAEPALEMTQPTGTSKFRVLSRLLAN